VSVIERIESDPDLSQKVHEQMHPGLLLVMTDAKAHPDTRSKNGFVVVTQDTGWTTDVSTPD
jgi:formylmethanofuran dehydrogenase subunit C